MSAYVCMGMGMCMSMLAYVCVCACYVSGIRYRHRHRESGIVNPTSGRFNGGVNTDQRFFSSNRNQACYLAAFVISSFFECNSQAQFFHSFFLKNQQVGGLLFHCFIGFNKKKNFELVGTVRVFYYVISEDLQNDESHV